MWTFEHTETTSATPAQLWARYADPITWAEWDHEIAVVTVQGPMAPGSCGTLKPVKGPPTRFRFTEVIPEVGFTDVSRLPFARMTFAHLIEAIPGGSRFLHRVTITGPLSPLFARVIGTKVAHGLPVAMQALARLAESNTDAIT
ncbi:MAG: SRPBCC family protein [Geodermatophilaceae bacterium]|nr:SRPBCC family protein [Geodermatophilaceae bacterium]MDQ3477252.1 SRPBCC family protein [Actinomycetota bacterium]